MGWAAKENGDLLQLAATSFDVFITVDQNLRYQQELSRFSIVWWYLQRGETKSNF
jgi:hypothetical protein